MLKLARSEVLAPLPGVLQTAITNCLPKPNFQFITTDACVEPIVEDLATRPFDTTGHTAHIVEFVKTVVMSHVNASVLLTHLSKIWVLTATADSDKLAREGESKWKDLLEDRGDEGRLLYDKMKLNR
jgi:PBP1b-binding outer membrane lipoprotein LpoB